MTTLTAWRRCHALHTDMLSYSMAGARASNIDPSPLLLWSIPWQLPLDPFRATPFSCQRLILFTLL